jgi:hypothetical protein
MQKPKRVAERSSRDLSRSAILLSYPMLTRSGVRWICGDLQDAVGPGIAKGLSAAELASVRILQYS